MARGICTDCVDCRYWQIIACFYGTHTHTCLSAAFSGLPGWAGTRKVKPIWILLKQETVSGSGISWAICKSAPCSRQITMPARHHSVFYRPDAQPTASKHWRLMLLRHCSTNCLHCLVVDCGVFIYKKVFLCTCCEMLKCNELSITDENEPG